MVIKPGEERLAVTGGLVYGPRIRSFQDGAWKSKLEMRCAQWRRSRITLFHLLSFQSGYTFGFSTALESRSIYIVE